jgi:hypothetical protein
MSVTPPTDTTPNTLFDGFVEEYETACARGVQLSGESRDYFAAERIRLTAAWPAAGSQSVDSSISDANCVGDA